MQEMLAMSSCDHAMGVAVGLQAGGSCTTLVVAVGAARVCCAASGNARPLRGGGRAQVGEFYEAQGTDAVMLVQWASLNPMGRKPPPRAGAPVVNLRRTLDDILQGSGLSIVRSQGPAYGCRAGHGCWDPRLTQMAGWNSP